MDRRTILHRTAADPKRLPLGALEAFALSQVDGHSSLEEIAAIVGLELAEMITLAKRFVELGAARGPAPLRRESVRSVRPPRHDPRAEAESIRPPRRDSVSSRRAAKTTPPASKRASIAPRRTRPSIPAAATARKQSSRPEEPCELDPKVQAAIAELEAKLGTHDHYALLGVERTAERKAVKHAYFALASKFHPDRHFGKKLGHARAPLERIFHRITEAHDVLTDRDRREVYDRTLPPPPISAPPEEPTPAARRRKTSKFLAQVEPAARASKTPPSARGSKAPPSARASKIPPSTRGSKAPPSARASKTPPSSPAASFKPPAVGKAPAISAPPLPPISRAAPKVSGPVARAIVPPPVSKPPPVVLGRIVPKVSGVRPLSPEAKKRVDTFIEAGDAALKANDVIAAANNYRLALQNFDDPKLRAKLDMVDDMAKARRFEISFPRARAAEREQRWAEAAFEYSRAHSARPGPDAAERAANALRMSEGDLAKATELAEWAVAKAPRNPSYRLTLGEIHLAARRFEPAEIECNAVLSHTPDEPRARALQAAITKAKRSVGR